MVPQSEGEWCEGRGESFTEGQSKSQTPRTCKDAGTRLQFRAPSAIQWPIQRLQEKEVGEGKKPCRKHSWPVPWRRREPGLCLRATPSVADPTAIRSSQDCCLIQLQFSHCDLEQTILPSRPGLPALKQRGWTGTQARGCA